MGGPQCALERDLVEKLTVCRLSILSTNPFWQAPHLHVIFPIQGRALVGTNRPASERAEGWCRQLGPPVQCWRRQNGGRSTKWTWASRGGVLILFDLSWPKDVAATEGDGTSKYTTMLWSETTSQVTHSRTRPLQNQAASTPNRAILRPRTAYPQIGSARARVNTVSLQSQHTSSTRSRCGGVGVYGVCGWRTTTLGHGGRAK